MKKHSKVIKYFKLIDCSHKIEHVRNKYEIREAFSRLKQNKLQVREIKKKRSKEVRSQSPDVISQIDPKLLNQILI